MSLNARCLPVRAQTAPEVVRPTILSPSQIGSSCSNSGEPVASSRTSRLFRSSDFWTWRRSRGSTSSRRSRIRVSEGDFPTPKSERRLRARIGSSPPRTCRSNWSRDGILSENTASPDIRQSERLKSRERTGSGTRSKHSRITRSMPGIDRCLRMGFPDPRATLKCNTRSGGDLRPSAQDVANRPDGGDSPCVEAWRLSCRAATTT